ncbi:MAG: hypothetical protein MJ252_28810 [archaeon]|nr:hypothetical protein [archaeon]
MILIKIKMKIIIHFFFLFLLKKVFSQIIYIPFDSNKKKPINSIFGTGNRLQDITYRAYCTILCNNDKYSDKHCCEGNSFDEMKCLSKIDCDKITGDFQDYVFRITFISYFSLLIISGIVSAIVCYCMTKDESYKKINALVAFILVFAGGLVIPFIFIKVYCCCINMPMGRICGANFDSCGGDKLIQSVEVKEERRMVRFIDENKSTKKERDISKTENDHLAEVEMADQKNNNEKALTESVTSKGDMDLISDDRIYQPSAKTDSGPSEKIEDNKERTEEENYKEE